MTYELPVIKPKFSTYVLILILHIFLIGRLVLIVRFKIL